MLYCRKCGIEIEGDKESCPLCQGPLEGTPEPSPFPVIPEPRLSRLSFFRICTFVMLVLETAFIITRFLVDRPWVTITIVFILIAWADIWVTMYFRRNVIKLIHMQFFIGMAIILIMRLLGMYGSHDAWVAVWFYPAAFLAMAVSTLAVGKGMGIPFEVYAIYVLWDILFSFLQLIPLFLHENPMPLPALISMGLMFLLGAAILLFKGREMKRASSKWFHF